MRNMSIIFALFMMSTSASAQTPSPEQLMASALDSYAKVAGGWYLNTQCKFLGNPLATEFEQNVATINIALAAEVNSPKILFMIQKAAKETSQSEKYAKCEKNSEDIVIRSVLFARNWSKQIKKIQSQQKR